ncbi:unnamed protein product [Caenorhabditis auriculariae]|uniref:SUN domain-containing protein n=1 Tax=Caenorhabditis auriculariae TaxID=2777116 RepID=A0A8S1H0P9_9PELO|nr:unnamed protein product [Caenorhabditis auriculariae]
MDTPPRQKSPTRRQPTPRFLDNIRTHLNFKTPPVRSAHSPRFTDEELDALTSNLPYQTNYTYAFSKIYDPSLPDHWEVPNLGPLTIKTEQHYAAASISRQVFDVVCYYLSVLLTPFYILVQFLNENLLVLFYDLWLFLTYLPVTLYRSVSSAWSNYWNVRTYQQRRSQSIFKRILIIFYHFFANIGNFTTSVLLAIFGPAAKIRKNDEFEESGKESYMNTRSSRSNANNDIAFRRGRITAEPSLSPPRTRMPTARYAARSELAGPSHDVTPDREATPPSVRRTTASEGYQRRSSRVRTVADTWDYEDITRTPKRRTPTPTRNRKPRRLDMNVFENGEDSNDLYSNTKYHTENEENEKIEQESNFFDDILSLFSWIPPLLWRVFRGLVYCFTIPFFAAQHAVSAAYSTIQKAFHTEEEEEYAPSGHGYNLRSSNQKQNRDPLAPGIVDELQEKAENAYYTAAVKSQAKVENWIHDASGSAKTVMWKSLDGIAYYTAEVAGFFADMFTSIRDAIYRTWLYLTGFVWGFVKSMGETFIDRYFDALFSIKKTIYRYFILPIYRLSTRLCIIIESTPSVIYEIVRYIVNALLEMIEIIGSALVDVLREVLIFIKQGLRFLLKASKSFINIYTSTFSTVVDLLQICIENIYKNLHYAWANLPSLQNVTNWVPSIAKTLNDTMQTVIEHVPVPEVISRVRSVEEGEEEDGVVPVLPLSIPNIHPNRAPEPVPIDQAAIVANVMAKVREEMKLKLKSFEESYETIIAKLNSQNLEIKADYSQLESMVRQMILEYDADKTGKVDFALESSGASVLTTRCSETFNTHTRLEKIWNIPLWYTSYGPRTVIQRNSKTLFPGECWSFKGDRGYIAIDLSHEIELSSISYEHIGKDVAPNGVRSSAPRNFKIWAYKDVDDMSTRVEVGDYTYELDGPPLQFFFAQNQPDYPVKNTRNGGHEQLRRALHLPLQTQGPWKSSLCSLNILKLF